MKKQDTEKVKALKKEVEKDLRAANMRIRRMEEQGVNSPAHQALRDELKTEKPRFKMGKNPSYNDLQKLHADIKKYMNMESSSLRGWTKIQTKTLKGLEKAGINVKKENLEEFWKVYERLKEKDKSIVEKQLKYNVFKAIEEMLNGNTDLDTITKELENQIDEIYREQQKQNEEFDEAASQFFSGQ